MSGFPAHQGLERIDGTGNMKRSTLIVALSGSTTRYSAATLT